MWMIRNRTTKQFSNCGMNPEWVDFDDAKVYPKKVNAERHIVMHRKIIESHNGTGYYARKSMAYLQDVELVRFTPKVVEVIETYQLHSELMEGKVI